MPQFRASELFKKIYLSGNSGFKPNLPFDFASLEKLAKSKMSKEAFDYVATGAGNHRGILNNTKAFQNYEILPRMAHGINEVNLESKLFNTRLPVPIMFAPVGVLELAHPNADLELAMASKSLEVPMILSNQASIPMEQVANVLCQTDHWFQLYFSKNYELVESFVQRAERCGSKAIVLTLDTTTLGWRSLDLGNGFLPFARGMGIAQYTSDPIFKMLIKDSVMPMSDVPVSLNLIWNTFQMMRKYPGSFLKNFRSKEPILAVRKFLEIYSKPNLNWEDIIWLRSKTKLPIILKGILRSDDALKAVDIGIDGIIVSNHGARQLDQVIGSVNALVEIKKHLPSEYPLLIDSGIRSGTDIFISLALGAKSVLLGRPYVYSLAIGGSN
ncbi:MAG: alpha-hydroxy-acid oxidizing protein, partial [Saprospiraceae bacterium]